MPDTTNLGYYICLCVEVVLVIIGIIVLLVMLKRSKATKKEVSAREEFTSPDQPTELTAPQPNEDEPSLTEVAEDAVQPEESAIVATEENPEPENSEPEIIEQQEQENSEPEIIKQQEQEKPEPEIIEPEMQESENDEQDDDNTASTDENSVVINASGSVSITEKYEALSREQKSFFDELKKYALSKPDAKLSATKSYENIKIGRQSLLKLMIKRKITVAVFILENELLAKYRRESKGDANIKIKGTEIPVYDIAALNAALDMIDISMEQIAKDKEDKEEERKAKRRKL